MQKKAKMLMVADTYYPKVDGTLRFMEEFSSRTNNFDLSLLVPDLGKHKKLANVNKINYLKPSSLINLSGYPNMKISWNNFKKIKQAIKNSELIFIQGPALISYLSMYYGKRYNKKTIFYVHVISWELFEKFLPPIINRLFFKIFKKISIVLYNRCDNILVPYHELKNELEKAGVRSEIKIAKLGVDIEKFSPTNDKRLSKEKIGIKNNKTVIGYVGRISKEKNVKILLKAFKKLENQQKFHLLIVGDGNKELVEPFKEIKNCTVTGFVDNVQDYLKAMDIFVMPSLTETSSLATLEAMSCGIPVITSKVGFMKSYIISNHNGLFFPRNKATMLAIKIEKILREQELRQKLSQNARKTIAYSFSWGRSINKMKRLILEKYFQHKE